MYKSITFFAVLTLIGYLYDKYKQKENKRKYNDNDTLIQNYLLEHNLTHSEPVIWIHVPCEKNSRKWLHWGSRNTTQVNQPYLYLCLKTIMQKANGSFRVCMIDDSSFNVLLPHWTLDLGSIPEPSRNTTRTLLLMQLLYKYGGMHLPLSFIALRELDELYTMSLQKHECFVGSALKNNIPYNYEEYMVNTSIMGCIKESIVMKDIIDTFIRITTTDFTHEHILEGKLEGYIETQIQQNNIYLLPPEYLGLVDNNNTPITIEKLMEPKENNTLNQYSYGIVIPSDKLLTRSKYQWYTQLSFEDVLNVNNLISHYLLISHSI